MYTFLLFANNLLVCNLKVLIFTKLELFMPFLKLTECYSKLLPTTSATCRLFSCTFQESKSVDVSKRVYVMLCNLWMCSFFTWSLLVKLQCASCIPSRTDRIVNVGAKWSIFLFIWCHIKSEKKFSVVVVLSVIFLCCNLCIVWKFL